MHFSPFQDEFFAIFNLLGAILSIFDSLRVNFLYFSPFKGEFFAIFTLEGEFFAIFTLQR